MENLKKYLFSLSTNSQKEVENLIDEKIENLDSQLDIEESVIEETI